MSGPVRLDVYFDYGSPFAYFASELLPALAARHGAALAWKPVAIRALGSYIQYSPVKGRYVVLDVQRSAEYHRIKVVPPKPFPVASALALAVGLAAQDAGLFDALHPLLFRAAWAEQRDVSSEAVLGELIEKAGGTAADLLARARRPDTAERLAANAAEAERRGAFGLPSVFLGDELFWGVDSFPQLEWRLRRRAEQRATPAP
jgi:2-hydroxychromene-2-carboxylate isomerase